MIEATIHATPAGFGQNPDSEPVSSRTGKSRLFNEILKLDEPRQFNSGKPSWEGSTQPPFKNTSLMERITYPFRAGAQRLTDGAIFGALAGGGTTALIGGGAGGAIGGGLGICLASITKLIKGGSFTKLLSEHSVLGGLVGGMVGAVMSATPGAVIGALAFAVCSLVKGVIQFPLDIVHAFRSSDPQLPESTFRSVAVFARETLNKVNYWRSAPMLLTEALKEMGLEAKDLDIHTLNEVFLQRKQEMDSNKQGEKNKVEYQRLTDARDLLEQALKLGNPIPELVELQQKYIPGVESLNQIKTASELAQVV